MQTTLIQILANSVISLSHSFISLSPIFTEIIQMYKSGLPSNISAYYLQDEEIFSCLMEMYIAILREVYFLLNSIKRKGFTNTLELLIY